MDKFKVPDFKGYLYKKNPIKEALAEIRFDYEAGEDFDTAIPGQFYEAVKGDFPEKQSLSVISFTVGSSGTISPKGQVKKPQAPIMQAWEKDRSHLLQIGPGIFTANSVKYERWERFSPCIETGLSAFQKVASPKDVNRVATRYINRFMIEDPNINLSDYFNFGISVPKALEGSDAFQVFFENQPWDIDDIGKFGIKVRFGTDNQRSDESGLPILLDIDCFTTDYHRPLEISHIKKTLDIAHTLVGFTFESFLTDKLRKIMGGRLK